ncbi:MAG: C4-dicarboxylate ABC transporter substrate-binding protein [Deltaproteobacteria bacterium RBG_16_49_23]|nr:MAG: C4-dicarboxylate ABC transporter substrate-binding protein [Deltaproteobacteria bacterium RBG_16_49_23]
MKRFIIFGIIALFMFGSSTVWAQKTVRLSIATGGTGGVYYPLGGGMANIISKHIPYTEATAEVTTASVDNCRLVGAGKAELALIMADTGWDAYQGKAQFKEKVPLRTIAVLYPNNMHIVTAEGKGIEKVTDLKGKRVSTGAPGSGTEVMALRVIEAYGLDPTKDMTRDKLGVSESAGALKDRKIDAFFWVGGLPTAAVTDFGATPGVKIKLISHVDAVPKMRETYGPIYVKGVIPTKTYPGQDVDVPISIVWNLLVCNENMKGDVAYDIVKTLFDRKPELVNVHREARWLSLEPQATGGSPIPFHPGAIRYFKEKGITVK